MMMMMMVGGDDGDRDNDDDGEYDDDEGEDGHPHPTNERKLYKINQDKIAKSIPIFISDSCSRKAWYYCCR